MILSKTVTITLISTNIYYYESLGYFIPRYLDKNDNIWKVKRNTKIIINLKDLPKQSQYKVLCKCDNCGKENFITYQALQNYDYFKIFNKYLCQKCVYQDSIFRQKMSDNNGMRGKSRELSPVWNSKITDEERLNNRRILGFTKWKKLVKERDNYTCQCCGSKENLEVHHINNWRNFKEQRVDINNGITLCQECHKAKNNKSIHSLYGKFTTKENFLEFLKSSQAV